MRICGVDEPEVVGVVPVGNVTKLKIVDMSSSESVGIIYSTCEFDAYNVLKCQLLIHHERPGRMPLEFFSGEKFTTYFESLY